MCVGEDTHTDNPNTHTHTHTQTNKQSSLHPLFLTFSASAFSLASAFSFSFSAFSFSLAARSASRASRAAWRAASRSCLCVYMCFEVLYRLCVCVCLSLCVCVCAVCVGYAPPPQPGPPPRPFSRSDTRLRSSTSGCMWGPRLSTVHGAVDLSTPLSQNTATTHTHTRAQCTPTCRSFSRAAIWAMRPPSLSPRDRSPALRASST